MFGCLKRTATVPSEGRFMPTKRRSRRAVLALSRTLSATIRPEMVSRARQTLRHASLADARDQLEAAADVELLDLGLAAEELLEKLHLLAAVVDDAGNLRTQLRPRHDAVDESVRQQELARLKPLRAAAS